MKLKWCGNVCAPQNWFVTIRQKNFRIEFRYTTQQITFFPCFKRWKGRELCRTKQCYKYSFASRYRIKARVRPETESKYDIRLGLSLWGATSGWIRITIIYSTRPSFLVFTCTDSQRNPAQTKEPIMQECYPNPPEEWKDIGAVFASGWFPTILSVSTSSSRCLCRNYIGLVVLERHLVRW